MIYESSLNLPNKVQVHSYKCKVLPLDENPLYYRLFNEVSTLAAEPLSLLR